MIDSLLAWLGSESTPVAFAIISGVIGFLAKAIYDLWLARRNDKLDRINQQLKLLYGPLYALNQASSTAWSAFERRWGSTYESPAPPGMEEAFRRWMLTIFRPIHEDMLSTITKNADLLIEDDLPPQLKHFCAHVLEYKVIFANWEAGDFSENKAALRYPARALAAYLEAAFRVLKQRQLKLLGNQARLAVKELKKVH